MSIRTLAQIVPGCWCRRGVRYSMTTDAGAIWTVTRTSKRRPELWVAEWRYFETRAAFGSTAEEPPRRSTRRVAE